MQESSREAWAIFGSLANEPIFYTRDHMRVSMANHGYWRRIRWRDGVGVADGYDFYGPYWLSDQLKKEDYQKMTDPTHYLEPHDGSGGITGSSDKWKYEPAETTAVPQQEGAPSEYWQEDVRTDGFKIHVEVGRSPDAANSDLEPAIEQAYRVTRSSRQEEYDHPLINFLRTAVRETVEFREKLDGKVFTPYDVAKWMVVMKKARMEKAAKKDSVTDDIGYMDCADRIALWLVENCYCKSWEAAMHYFDGWDFHQLWDFLIEVEEKERAKQYE